MTSTSIYLSRLILDLGSRQVLSELAEPYEMHRTLMKAFPAVTGEVEARSYYGVLFRAEVDEKARIARVYVQSNVEPDWSVLCHLGSYLCWDAAVPAYDCKDITGALKSIGVGQTLAFRLRANPTKRLVREGDPLSGKRVALFKEDEQIEWLRRKGNGEGGKSPGGFDLVATVLPSSGGTGGAVPQVRVRPEGIVRGRKRAPGGGHLTTHFSVLFEGLLKVTDATAFVETVRRGVGPGKAYGFGLLSIAPARLWTAES